MFCYFLFIYFIYTKSFAELKLYPELLPSDSLPHAQNCQEFGLFNGNHNVTGIPRADLSQLEDGLRDVACFLHGVPIMIML